MVASNARAKKHAFERAFPCSRAPAAGPGGRTEGRQVLTLIECVFCQCHRRSRGRIEPPGAHQLGRSAAAGPVATVPPQVPALAGARGAGRIEGEGRARVSFPPGPAGEGGDHTGLPTPQAGGLAGRRGGGDTDTCRYPVPGGVDERSRVRLRG